MSQVNSNEPILLFESYCRKNDIDGKEIEALVSNVPVRLKVASTPQSQMQGYMGAEESPSENEGILFVYDKPMPLAFWMKQVKFPLDIIFFDDKMEYINHETMNTTDETEDHKMPQHRSQAPARFAVELPAGWCDKNLKPECKLSF
jgi:uncharacterized membrane protein (UPF0127 family)